MKFLIFIILFSAFQTHAMNLEDALYKKFSPFVKTFPSEARFYHYFEADDPRLQDPEGRAQWVQSRFAIAAHSFWHTSEDNGWMRAGPGLYSSSDIYSSKSYGSFGLEIQPAKKAKYLDLEALKNTPPSEDFFVDVPEGPLKKEFLSLFPANNYNINALYLSLINPRPSTELRELLRRVTQKLNIIAYDVSWNYHLTMCSDAHQILIMVFIGQQNSVLVDEVDISQLKGKIFKIGLTKATSEEQAYTEKLLIKEKIITSVSNKQNQSFTNEQVTAVKKSILNCE